MVDSVGDQRISKLAYPGSCSEMFFETQSSDQTRSADM